MKYTRLIAVMLLICLIFVGCGSATEQPQGDTIVATTYPMYYLCSRLSDGMEGVRVEALITEEVSCLHDYTITTTQMRLIEGADMVVLSGAGLEHFMESALENVPAEKLVDSSAGVELIGDDPHIWMDPERYARQGDNIAAALSEAYPEQKHIVESNAQTLHQELLELKARKTELLSALDQTNIITFHDGFAYFADAYGLTILAAIEEEEGAEPSAAEIKEICDLVEEYDLGTIYLEGTEMPNAARIVIEEAAAKGRALHHNYLSMIMSASEDGYIGQMNGNIDVMIIQEENK